MKPCRKSSYKGRPEFFIDIAVFKGSSGSPVLTMNGEPSSQETKGENRPSVRLLGILHEGPWYTVEASLDGMISTFDSYMNLGGVIKSKKLLDFAPLLISMVGKDISEIGDP